MSTLTFHLAQNINPDIAGRIRVCMDSALAHKEDVWGKSVICDDPGQWVETDMNVLQGWGGVIDHLSQV